MFGELIAADLGWSRTRVYGGFSLALLAMGLVSPLVGRHIDRHGGGPVMAAGSALCAAGCVMLAISHTTIVYYAGWLCLGVAMRATLYDAAFATLARIGGAAARRPMAQVTLLGGLAATCFWPLGHLLADVVGWRGALWAYAGIAVLTLPLHLSLPNRRYEHDHGDDDGVAPERHPPPPLSRRDGTVAALLYTLIFTLINGLNAGMSAHMIAILSELGLGAALAVSIAALRGVGQSAARLAEVLFGARLTAVDLNLLAALVLPGCFAAGLAAGVSVAAAVVFAFGYGAGNGILSITRGTLPLVLFDLRTYGAFVGRLLVPGFIVAAAAPLAFAAVIERHGATGALIVSIVLVTIVLAAALALKHLLRR